MYHISHLLIATVGEFHIVDADHTLGGVQQEVAQLIDRGHRHRKVAFRDTVRNNATLEIQVVKEDILRHIILITHPASRRAANLLLLLAVEFGTLRA